MTISYDEIAKRAGVGQPAPQPVALPNPAKSQLSFPKGFAKSTIWHGGPEMIGLRSPPELEAWQTEHPVANILSGLAGWAVPYGVGAKLALKIPTIAKGVKFYSSPEMREAAPVVSAAARNILQFTPLEVARTVAGATVAEDLAPKLNTEYEGTPGLALNSGADLALIGGISGVGGVLGQYGRRILNKRGIVPGADLNKPLQEQLKDLNRRISAGEIADAALAQGAAERLRAQIRMEGPGSNARYIGSFENNPNPKVLNRFFAPRIGETLDVKTYSTHVLGPGFPDRPAWEKHFAEAGLAGHEDAIQYPRFIQAKTPKMEQVVERNVLGNMQSIDSAKGWYWNQDKADGLFVMARKLGGGRWTVFKTAEPGRFLPDHQDFLKVTQGRAFQFKAQTKQVEPLSDDINAPTVVADTLARYKLGTPVFDFRGLRESTGKISSVSKAIGEATGLNKLADTHLRTASMDLVNKYFAPRMLQFRNSPLGGHIMAGADIAKATAEAFAQRLFFGAKVGKYKEGSIWKALWKGVDPEDHPNSISALIDDLYREGDRAVDAYQATVIGGRSVEEGVREFGLTEIGQKLLQRQTEVDNAVMEGIAATQKLFGEGNLSPLAHHYMLSRTWKGSWRVPIIEGNKPIGFASGSSRGAALSDAQSIINAAKESGVELRMKDPLPSDTVQSDFSLLHSISEEGAKAFGTFRLKANAPKRLVKERMGAQFFIGQRERWQKSFVKESILKQLRDYQLYNAKLATEGLYKDDLLRLLSEDRTTAEMVNQRLLDTFGTRGAVEIAQDKFMDTALAPAMGVNSASKIVSGLNKAMFHLSFGFLNTGFNLANLLNFVVTALPHIAYISHLPPGDIARWYSMFPVKGTRTMEAMGTLDILKVGKQSFKYMGNPTPELRGMIERSLVEGVTDPKFVEAWVGQNATAVKDWRLALTGEEPVTKWLGAVSGWMPSMSERFARGHSFVLGYTFFKDVAGIKDPEILYQLAKGFTEKTQFLYSTADRPTIFSGAFGSTFGLFKNWVAHYLGWMAVYTGEGVAHGNWAPLLWMNAGTALVGGIGASPMYGAANAASRLLNDKSLMANTYAWSNGTEEDHQIADTIFHGIPGFLGFTLQPQVAAPGADPGTDAARLFNFALLNRASALGKLGMAAVDAVQTTGQNPVQSQEVRDLFMQTFAPRTMARTYQAVQGEMMRSLSTGKPIIGVTPMERFAYALGVDPVTVNNGFAVSGELWASQDKTRAAVSAYGQKWLELSQEGDVAGISRLLQRAAVEGLDLNSISKSFKAQQSQSREDLVGRNFQLQDVEQYRSIGLLPPR